MQKEELSREAPVAIGRFVLTPVVRLSLHHIGAADRGIYYVSKHPLYILIDTASGIKAFTMDGLEIPAEQVESALCHHPANQKAS